MAGVKKGRWRVMNVKKLIIVLVAGMIILTGCRQAGEQEAAVPSEPQVITFADSMVEQETRKILNKPTGAITEEEVLTITEFGQWERDGVSEFFEGEVTTLSDLKWFKNLKRLYLSRCGVQSLEGIEDLIALEGLYIRSNEIQNLEPIKNLKNLVEFDCADNPISDYSVLSGLTKLEWLSIGESLATDLSMVKNLTELKKLYAPYCGISDLSPLKNLDKLEYLQLKKNDINDIEALAGLQRLNYLNIEENQVSDISALYDLPNLQTVDLDKNPIPDGELNKFYEPRESDYVTVTFREKIREDMPLFCFDLAAHYDRRSNVYALDTITVTDLSDERVLQTTSIPELTQFGETAISEYNKETMGFELEDMNFDGYQDVRLYDTANGNYLVEWIYLIWNPQNQRFEPDKRLNEIPLAKFDQEEKVIYGMTRGSATSHSYYTYQYEGQEILLMEEVSENYEYLTEEEKELLREVLPSLSEETVEILHIVRKKRNMSSNKVEIVENTLSTVIEGTIHEYNFDSPVGRKLWEMRDWID